VARFQPNVALNSASDSDGPSSLPTHPGGRHGHARRHLLDALEQPALDVLAQAADRVGPAEIGVEDSCGGLDDARDGLDEPEREPSVSSSPTHVSVSSFARPSGKIGPATIASKH